MNPPVDDEEQDVESPSSANDEVTYAHPLQFPYYKRQFVLPEMRRSTTGYLTYGLLPDSPIKRILLLVDDLANPVPDSRMDEYRAFLAELESNQSLGGMAKTKSFVVRLRTDKAVCIRFPNVTVAVHKMGPVPVFDTGMSVKVELHGETVIAQIVAYHDPRPARSSAGTSVPVYPDELLVESLDYDLHVVFQRYHEDVAAQLADIANHANLARALQWTKECEIIIGQSYSTKLALIAPDPEQRRVRGGFDEWQW